MTMQNEDIDDIPTDEPGMWKSLREEFENAYFLFCKTKVEDLEDALQRRTSPQDMTLVIAYRGTSDEYDSREYYLNMGRSLLLPIELSLDQQKITPLFLQQWAMLMFCKGFITSYMLDDSNSTSHIVGGADYAALVRKRRIWIAKMMAPLLDGGMSRKKAESVVFDRIKAIIDAGLFTSRFSKEWFEDLITSGEPNKKEATKLKTTFDTKHFSTKKIRELAKEEDEDIRPY